MTPDALAAPQADIEPQIRLEQLASLYAMSRPAMVGGAAYAIVVVYMLASPLGGGLTVPWLVIKLLILAARLADGVAFQRDRYRAERLSHWQRRFAIGLAIDSISWGVMTPLFIPSHSDLVDGLMLAGTAGVSASGVFSLSSHRVASLGFLATMIVPIVVLELALGSSVQLASAAAFLIFAVVLALECLKSHERFAEMTRLRFANAAIAEERQRALLIAEHSNAAKSRFLASVSHELRTPLNGIIGMTQFLADEPLSATQRERLAVLRHSAEHLVTVIGDLLDISRIDFNRIELNPRPERIEETVRDVTDLLESIAHERRLGFHVTFAPDLPGAAMLDAARVKQVLHNLIGNALKFTHQGEIRIVVSCKRDLLRFDVIDTGEGIPPGDIERIFNAFEQAASQQPVRAGAGLGLTISRSLARAMGGDVVCRSQPGAGTQFRFLVAYVPAPEVPPPRKVISAWHALADELDSSPPLRGHVLVAEDNDVNALVVTSMLTQLGLGFEHVPDGKQALERLVSTEFDLVLMDCQMPVLDGWDATRAWRAIEARRPGAPHLPVIALTASAAAGEREHCLAAGMDDYLSKPFSRQALSVILKKHLEGDGPEGAGDR